MRGIDDGELERLEVKTLRERNRLLRMLDGDGETRRNFQFLSITVIRSFFQTFIERKFWDYARGIPGRKRN